jgi:histidyl-tRNA synthetase
MDRYSLPQNGSAWQAERGSLGLWVPCPALLVIATHGHGHAELAAPIVEAYRTLRQKNAIYVFADIEEMSNYDSRLRVELTAAFSPDRARIAALHVLLKSKLVAMGMSARESRAGRHRQD